MTRRVRHPALETPVLDELKRLSRKFLLDDGDLEGLCGMQPSEMDRHLLEVVEKHGLDLSDAGAWGDDEGEPVE